jgi:hypothetical protein
MQGCYRIRDSERHLVDTDPAAPRDLIIRKLIDAVEEEY